MNPESLYFVCTIQNMFLSRNENRNGMGRDMPLYDVVLGKVRQNGRKKTSSLVAMVLALEYSYYQVVN